MIALPRRLTPVYLVLALGIAGVFFYYHSLIGHTISSHTPSLPVVGRVRPANGTLGFGGIFVVSGPGSPRRSHLEQAAAVTELDLTIPEQVAWSGQDILDFRYENVTESKVGLGSVKAWLSHHLVLKAFLDSGVETALILEDDVDWDIRLRTQQIPLAQVAARTLTSSKATSAQYPWGDTTKWDLLYLGHCGDYFNNLEDGIGVGHHHQEHLTSIPHVSFPDPSMPDRSDLHPFTASLLTALRVPQQTRVLHQSKWPLCSFGYAVTRVGAQKILTDVAPPKEDLSRGLIAYDAALLAGCRSTSPLHPGALECFSMTPELFHHMEGKSIIALEEEQHDRSKQVFRPPVDVAGFEQVWWRKETSNIGCGFWSGEFYYDYEEKKLEGLRGEGGEEGGVFEGGEELMMWAFQMSGFPWIAAGVGVTGCDGAATMALGIPLFAM